ncbi:MAG: hypothetical protein ACHBN1_35445 [Heteroscytonema crispum UTEX LB 1556]
MSDRIPFKTVATSAWKMRRSPEGKLYTKLRSLLDWVSFVKNIIVGRSPIL